MASDYGFNFGFLRSDESVRVSEGRFKTPVGSALLLGTMVEVDPASAGYLKASAADAAIVTGFSGLLVQELEWDRSIYESGPELLDTYQMGVAKADRLAVITSGAGTKVWLKNNAQIDRADGRTVAARTVVDLTGVAVGDDLAWDGTQYVELGVSATTNALMRVTALITDGVEAVLLG